MRNDKCVCFRSYDRLRKVCSSAIGHFAIQLDGFHGRTRPGGNIVSDADDDAHSPNIARLRLSKISHGRRAGSARRASTLSPQRISVTVMSASHQWKIFMSNGDAS